MLKEAFASIWKRSRRIAILAMSFFSLQALAELPITSLSSGIPPTVILGHPLMKSGQCDVDVFNFAPPALHLLNPLKRPVPYRHLEQNDFEVIEAGIVLQPGESFKSRYFRPDVYPFLITQDGHVVFSPRTGPMGAQRFLITHRSLLARLRRHLGLQGNEVPPLFFAGEIRVDALEARLIQDKSRSAHFDETDRPPQAILELRLQKAARIMKERGGFPITMNTRLEVFNKLLSHEHKQEAKSLADIMAMAKYPDPFGCSPDLITGFDLMLRLVPQWAEAHSLVLRDHLAQYGRQLHLAAKQDGSKFTTRIRHEGEVNAVGATLESSLSRILPPNERLGWLHSTGPQNVLLFRSLYRSFFLNAFGEELIQGYRELASQVYGSQCQ